MNSASRRVTKPNIGVFIFQFLAGGSDILLLCIALGLFRRYIAPQESAVLCRFLSGLAIKKVFHTINHGLFRNDSADCASCDENEHPKDYFFHSKKNANDFLTHKSRQGYWKAKTFRKREF